MGNVTRTSNSPEPPGRAVRGPSGGAQRVARRPDRVLVIDDDAAVRTALCGLLRVAGYEATGAEGAVTAEAAVLGTVPDVALIDLRLPDGDGIELIPRLRAVRPDLAVIVLTGHATIDAAVTAIKRGADQFLTKPVDGEALVLIITRVLEDHRNQQRRRATQARSSTPQPLLGTSRAMRHLADDVESMRQTDVPVLILGETGTGKGVLARWLHESGPRAAGPFVDLNCAGISRELLDAELFGHEAGAFTGAVKAKPGLLDVAHGGTVFLDEIGDMDTAIQARLLKVLEEKRFRRLGDVRDRSVDIRLIAATHQDIQGLIAEGRFRRDLYFRVSAVELRMPPLRERSEDIEALAGVILEAFAREVGRPVPTLSAGTREMLCAYAWPGNVRELRNVLETAALRCGRGTLEPEDLRLRSAPTACVASATLPGDLPTLAEVERAHIQRVLTATGGHVARAAHVLGVSTSSLYDRLHRLSFMPSRAPAPGGLRDARP